MYVFDNKIFEKRQNNLLLLKVWIIGWEIIIKWKHVLGPFAHHFWEYQVIFIRPTSAFCLEAGVDSFRQSKMWFCFLFPFLVEKGNTWHVLISSGASLYLLFPLPSTPTWSVRLLFLRRSVFSTLRCFEFSRLPNLATRVRRVLTRLIN